LDSTQAGNTVAITAGSGYTRLAFANGQTTLTLDYAGAPGANDIGFFSGALCATSNVCKANGTTLPVSTLTSQVWSSNPVWVPNLVWQSNMVWVLDVVWVSNWVWVADWECASTDADGNCTSYEDDGYYKDDGSDVDEGGYPSDNLVGGLTVLIP